MKMHLDLLPDFLRGTAFLGTGGGGDPYVGGLILRQKLEEGADITIMDPMDLDDDDFVVSVANMGAPTVMVEKIPSALSMVKCLRSIEREKGRKADALIAAEAGGINGTLPMVVGALTGLPVVDGDGMGRAFPELQMCTFGVYGVPASPIVLRDEHDNEVVVRARSNLEAEWFARVVCTRMGTKAEIALYAMSGKEAKESGVLYTTTLAMEIGRSIREARETQSDPFAGLARYFKTSRDKRFCKVLFEGKVVDLLRETTRGWAIGAGDLRRHRQEHRATTGGALPERVPGRPAGRAHARHGAGPDLHPRSGKRRADHHRGTQVRPAGARGGRQRAAGDAHARGARRVRPQIFRDRGRLYADRRARLRAARPNFHPTLLLIPPPRAGRWCGARCAPAAPGWRHASLIFPHAYPRDAARAHSGYGRRNERAFVGRAAAIRAPRRR